MKGVVESWGFESYEFWIAGAGRVVGAERLGLVPPVSSVL